MYRDILRMFNRTQLNIKIIPGIFIILYVFLIIINQSVLGLSDTHHIDFFCNKPVINRISFTANNNSHYKKLKQQTGDESAPWSNAFNFRKSMCTNVDPRTDILSAYIKAGAMLSNLGHGPNIDLEVNYSSSSQANPDGLGVGWSWNLTHFNLVTHQLITSTGHNFFIND